MYDIGPNHIITQIVPGLNLFTDQHRIHCGSLTANIIWLSRYLVKVGFYLEALPLLTFSHYLAHSICKDLRSVIEVKLLRIESLCHLNMFQLAFQYLIHVLTGGTLPGPAEIIRNKIQHRWSQLLNFKSIQDLKNQNILLDLCNFTLSQPHINVYGKFLCSKISVCQATLLVAMASVVSDTPTDDNIPTKEGAMEKLKEIKDTVILKTPRLPSKFRKSKEKTSDNINSISAIQEVVSMSKIQLTGRLFSAAETILEGVLKIMPSSVNGYQGLYYVFIGVYIS